jgi:hypothetical protein
MVIWRVLCAADHIVASGRTETGARHQQKLVSFTPGNSSLSDTDLAANKEDLRKFQLENVERELSMIYLNII